ncbi:MAG: SRPBCC family protein [Gammaproteobacteria bacterium]|nr:SRPBCC family protein [Gammaproteobacteria bacterium]
MKRSLIIFLMLFTFFLAILAYGYSLPVEHEITMRRHYAKPVAEVWQIIVDYKNYSQWRQNVYEVNEIPAEGKFDAWKEVDANGHSIAFEIVSLETNRIMIIEIKDATLPYDGQWTFELIPDATGTIVKITEHGKIDNLILRVIAHFVSGYTKNMDAWFNSLDNKFALEARIAGSKKLNTAPEMVAPEDPVILAPEQ